jgi:hypothetical protein
MHSTLLGAAFCLYFNLFFVFFLFPCRVFFLFFLILKTLEVLHKNSLSIDLAYQRNDICI